MFSSDTNSTQFAVPAIVTGVATLISPALAVIRWAQERSANRRYRDEIKHSKELADFIQRCPELLKSAGASFDLVDRAQIELNKSLTKIQMLMERKAAREAPPVELSWPRRWSLFYAPRSAWATVLHAIFQLLLVVFVGAVLMFSYNDELGAFEFNEVLGIFSHPALVVSLANWFLCLAMIWYAATSKDRWDGALPTTKSVSRFFLLRPAGSISEVMARLLLAWGSWDVMSALFLGPAIRTDADSFLKSMPELATRLRALPALPGALPRFLGWSVSIFSLFLAYLWAKGESKAHGQRLWLPFPHNLRFLYPSSGWEEAFAQAGLVLLLGALALTIYWTAKALGTLWPLIGSFVPEDARGSALLGAVMGSFPSVFFSLLPFYACYRVGLISHFFRSKGKSFVTSGGQ